ncbi:MAG TPA: hypothetical protein VKR83_18670 [Ktedonobacteraceae bacterium]|nr:hypothetical protein [Ktedonobacteraceae bacterium]
MIGSPSSTRQPPERPEQEPKKAVYTPKKRAGTSPTALFFKAIFRPIFKGLYYLLRAMRSHKLVSFLAIVLILGSAIAVNYYETGQLPLGLGYDQFNFHIHGTNGGGDQVKNWLYALRDGNTVQLSFLDRFLSQPPDPQQLVSQYSQSQGHLAWKSINVIGVLQEADSTIDSFVEVDVSANGPGGSVTGFLLVHFVTVGQSDGAIFGVDVITLRAPAQ